MNIQFRYQLDPAAINKSALHLLFKRTIVISLISSSILFSSIPAIHAESHSHIDMLSNFTMLDTNGNVFGGTNDVVFDWDRRGGFNKDESDTKFGQMMIASDGPTPFFGSIWAVHHVRIFGKGTHTFDTTCTTAQLETGVTDCNNPLDTANGQTERFITMTVGPGQVGAHMLYDWSTFTDIDVVNVWDRNAVWSDPDGTGNFKNDLWTGPAGTAPDPATRWRLVSTDANNDGINGVPMVDGPFRGYYINFNLGPVAPMTVMINDDTTGKHSLLFVYRRQR